MGLQLFVNKSFILRIARIAFVILISVMVSSSAWSLAHVKMTNIDDLAAKITMSASAQDLVVVEPFWYGISFMRYYHGAAPWITVPDISDHSVHRWDLAQAAVLDSEQLVTVFEKITNTLRSGHNVWFVSNLGFMSLLQKAPFNSQPISLKPNRLECDQMCFQRMANFTRMHAKTITIVPIKTDNPIHRFENVHLFMINGWQ